MNRTTKTIGLSVVLLLLGTSYGAADPAASCANGSHYQCNAVMVCGCRTIRSDAGYRELFANDFEAAQLLSAVGPTQTLRQPHANNSKRQMSNAADLSCTGKL